MHADRLRLAPLIPGLQAAHVSLARLSGQPRLGFRYRARRTGRTARRAGARDLRRRRLPLYGDRARERDPPPHPARHRTVFRRRLRQRAPHSGGTLRQPADRERPDQSRLRAFCRELRRRRRTRALAGGIEKRAAPRLCSARRAHLDRSAGRADAEPVGIHLPAEGARRLAIISSTARNLPLHPLIKPRNIHDDALVQPVADRLLLVARFDPEIERAAVDLDEFGGRARAHADRRRRVVAHVEPGAEALMADREQLLDRVERRGFDEVDHHRGREHAHAAAADERGRVLLADDEFGRSRQAGPQRRQVDHRGLFASGRKWLNDNSLLHDAMTMIRFRSSGVPVAATGWPTIPPLSTCGSRPRLVPRTRSSHSICGTYGSELRVQSGTRVIDLLVSFDSEVRIRTCARSESKDTSKSMTL